MADLAEKLETELPYLRRYARALTGSQDHGDDLAYQTLQAIQADRGILQSDQPVRINLFRVFHNLWMSTDRKRVEGDRGTLVDGVMSAFTPGSREALLLATIEGCTPAQIGHILTEPPERITHLLNDAKREMQRTKSGRILVIEDESLIAADLTRIVEQAGHQVIGVAATHQDAVRVAQQTPPDLILSDVQLADGSSGVDAVRDILLAFGTVPVVFITAFPEILLTGKRPEPAFLIAKPYTDTDVTSAVSQAMFFAAPQTLDAQVP